MKGLLVLLCLALDEAGLGPDMLKALELEFRTGSSRFIEWNCSKSCSKTRAAGVLRLAALGARRTAERCGTLAGRGCLDVK